MDSTFLLTIATVGIVLLFDYTNGFQEAANIVATVIASCAMTPAAAAAARQVERRVRKLFRGALADLFQGEDCINVTSQ